MSVNLIKLGLRLFLNLAGTSSARDSDVAEKNYGEDGEISEPDFDTMIGTGLTGFNEDE